MTNDQNAGAVSDERLAELIEVSRGRAGVVNIDIRTALSELQRLRAELSRSKGVAVPFAYAVRYRDGTRFGYGNEWSIDKCDGPPKVREGWEDRFEIVPLYTKAAAVPEELRRLSEKATQGEWQCGVDDDEEKFVVTTQDRDLGSLVPIAEGGVGYSGSVGSEQEANGDLIAAAVNWLRSRIADQGEG